MAAASPPFATSGATAASEDGNDSEGARGAAARPLATFSRNCGISVSQAGADQP